MKLSGTAQWSHGTQSWLQQELSQSKSCGAHPALDPAHTDTLVGLLAPCSKPRCKIKALVARCCWIQTSQVSVFQHWRWVLPSFRVRKTNLWPGWFICTWPHSKPVIEQGRSWGAAGLCEATSTPWCCSGQAMRQYKPRHSRINWQYGLCKVFLHLFYYVVSDTAKYPIIKGYKIAIYIDWIFIPLNANLKKWKLD